MKKSYIQPSLKAFPIIQTEIICGSGGSNQILSSGGGGNQPTPTNQGGNIGIYGDAKESFFDDEEYDDEW